MSDLPSHEIRRLLQEIRDRPEIPRPPSGSRFMILAAAATMLTVVGMAGALVVYLSQMSPAQQGIAVTVLLGFAGTTVTALLSLLRAEHNAQEQAKTRHDLKGAIQTTNLNMELTKREIEDKTNGNLQKAIATAAVVATEATKVQLMDELPLPKTRDEWREFIHEVVEEACKQAAQGKNRCALLDKQNPQGD